MHAEGNRVHVICLREEERGCFQVPSPGWKRRREIERYVLYFFSLVGGALGLAGEAAALGAAGTGVTDGAVGGVAAGVAGT